MHVSLTYWQLSVISLINTSEITEDVVFIVSTSTIEKALKIQIVSTSLKVTSAAWLAQSVEHQTFNLRVKGSSPLLG